MVGLAYLTTNMLYIPVSIFFSNPPHGCNALWLAQVVLIGKGSVVCYARGLLYTDALSSTAPTIWNNTLFYLWVFTLQFSQQSICTQFIYRHSIVCRCITQIR